MWSMYMPLQIFLTVMFLEFEIQSNVKILGSSGLFSCSFMEITQYRTEKLDGHLRKEKKEIVIITLHLL